MQRASLPVVALLALAGGCAPAPKPVAPAEACCSVSFEVTVPADTPTLYLAGNLRQLGPWAPDALALTGSGRVRTGSLRVPSGTALEYKFTLGSWEREALGPSGMVMGNFTLDVVADDRVAHAIGDFRKDNGAYIADWRGSGVRGTLVYWRDVESEFLDPSRHVSIWLPPGYEDSPERRYPVLYMHDGQNLFDPRIANTGVDWGVDEAIVALADGERMAPVIVVGVWSSSQRGLEYSPWHGAPDYARFLLEELMPRVNAAFRTLTGPSNTTVMGSSMGGLLSFYLVSTHPDVFGACGCLSTHFVFSESLLQRYVASAGSAGAADDTPYILNDIAAGARVPRGVRYWFDYGGKGLDAGYGPTHAAVDEWLRRQGLTPGRDFVMRHYPEADHNETSWRERLTEPLEYLYGRSD